MKRLKAETKPTTMKKGDFVKVKEDSYVYQIVDIEGLIATVKDGHEQLYTVELNRLTKYC